MPVWGGGSRGRGGGSIGGFSSTGYNFAAPTNAKRKRMAERSRSRSRSPPRFDLQMEECFDLSAKMDCGIPVVFDEDESESANDDLDKVFSDVTLSALWATAVAVAFLEKKLPNLKNDWTLMVQKSTRWMERTLATLPPQKSHGPASGWLAQALKLF